MKAKAVSGIMLVNLFLAYLTIQGGVRIAKTSSEPAIHVIPPQVTNVAPPGTFDINITVTDIVSDPGNPLVNGLHSWGLWLEFNPSILQVASHSEEEADVADRTGDGTQTIFQTDEWPVVPFNPDPPFYEGVYVNGTLMNQPADYTIVYSTGTITFTTAPGVGAAISILYRLSVPVYHVTSGHFLEKTGWQTAWGIGIVAPDINNVNGVVGVGDTIMPKEATGYPPEGATGNGLLATITFQVKAEGASLLHLDDTDLDTIVGEHPSQTFTSIDHTVEHGVFDNRAPPFLPPVADFYAKPPVAEVNETITFNASASYDPDGIIVSYEWDFGDGNMTTIADPVITHIYTSSGEYTVVLTVTDNDGLTSTAAAHITVIQAEPTPIISVYPPIITAEVNETFTVDITVADIASYESLYGWEFRIRFNDPKTDTWTGDGVTKSFVTSEKPVLYGSEEVYVNGTFMTKYVDYTINYTTGTITFKIGPKKRAPGLEAEIEAIYLIHRTLEVVSVMEGPFLKDTGHPTSWEMMPPKMNNAAGTVLACDALWTYPPQGATGSGVLCNITFQVKAIGKTTLHFYTTKLYTYNGTWVVPIDHATEDGYFDNTAEPRARISVYPPTSTAEFGETFTINVTVTDIIEEESLYSHESKISFNPQIINAVNAIEGPFLKDTGYDTIWLIPKIDNTAGTIRIGALIRPSVEWQGFPPNGAVGSGTLATVTFKAVGQGTTAIEFKEKKDTKLYTIKGEPPDQYSFRIEHTTEGGFFTNVPPPIIHVSPSEAPIGSKVAISGEGLTPNQRMSITFDDMQIGYAVTDDSGNFTFVFNIPLSEAGLHSIKARHDLNFVETSFTVIDVTPLEIQMDVGALFFKGETAEFYLQTCFNGMPVDATSINVTLCKPDGTVETLVTQRIATGLCKTEYLIKGKGSMLGTYVLVIEASYATSTVDSTGTCIKTFLVKEPYRTLEREAPKAALVAGSIGTILALVIAWRKRKQFKE